ncbi:ABATE domain-containing protein [Cupriavidus sp. 2SB]|uniref:CGNR zinc finger domain-containing protein n=1 Tax=Cupriavidus sp. 2SB TaxID=2502199 RepID=UPI0010F6B1A4|nr:ABATE domain-containing protein [Cupriavidus sp. 2SB]
MPSADSQPDHIHTPPRLLADHTALDLINTVELADGIAVDYWQTDADVVDWLAKVDLLPTDARGRAPKGLLVAARNLRELVRSLVSRKKAGKKIDVAMLNQALEAGGSHLCIQTGPHGALSVLRVYPRETAAQYLVPLAEAAVDLLVDGDFELVRKCESDECTLWFYDRTRSHRRRWCSMALCGNRHKVAAFRKREAGVE